MNAAPECLSSLEPLRNNCTHSDVQGSSAQRRLFAKHWAARARIITSLATSGNPWLLKRSNRLDGCRHSPQLRKDANGKASLSFDCCRDRLCPLCQAERGRVAANRIATLVKGWNSCRFATFTLKASTAGLSECLERLTTCVRSLRKDKYWRANVTQGVWSIEVTRNTNLHTWHAHVHLLIEGQFMPQKKLSDLWLSITGDSPICDIRAVPDRQSTANYIAEYVSKPFNVEAWQPAEICEFAKAMHGKRLLHTFGRAHGAKIDPPTEKETRPASELIGPLSYFQKAAAMGDDKSTHALEILRRMGPMFADASGQARNLPGLPRSPVEPWETQLVCDHLQHLTALAVLELPLYEPPVQEGSGIEWAALTETPYLYSSP